MPSGVLRASSFGASIQSIDPNGGMAMARFAVMTWNIENLFPVGAFVSPQSRTPVTQEAFDAKLDFLAPVILDKRPDVVALQEIGGSDASDISVVETLQVRLDGEYPHRAVSMHPDSRRIRVAFLSRLPIAGEINFSAFPAGPMGSISTLTSEARTSMSRGALKIDVEPRAGVRVQLITAHLKSKLLTYPRPGGKTSFSPANENERAFAAGVALFARAAEAATIRAFLNDEIQNAGTADLRTVVLGDLNDGPLAATTQLLLGPADGDIQTADSLDRVRLHNVTDAVPLRGTNFRTFLPENERYSRMNEGQPELIDNVLASKNLIYEGSEFKVISARSFVELIQGQSVTSDPNARSNATAPDHAPVMVEFDV
jgi:endonuclease/exonuclease/phosphatase family metal-dependent hydrolase